MIVSLFITDNLLLTDEAHHEMSVHAFGLSYILSRLLKTIGILSLLKCLDEPLIAGRLLGSEFATLLMCVVKGRLDYGVSHTKLIPR